MNSYIGNFCLIYMMCASIVVVKLLIQIRDRLIEIRDKKSDSNATISLVRETKES